MKVSQHFSIQEFVPPVTFSKWGNRSIWFIDPRIITLADAIRSHFGLSMTINNWHRGGVFSQRGYRPPTTTVGGKESQHRFGRAIDFNILGLTADAVRAELLRNEKKFMDLGLTTLEHGSDAPTWVHADIRQTGLGHILIVRA